MIAHDRTAGNRPKRFTKLHAQTQAKKAKNLGFQLLSNHGVNLRGGFWRAKGPAKGRLHTGEKLSAALRRYWKQLTATEVGSNVIGALSPLESMVPRSARHTVATTLTVMAGWIPIQRVSVCARLGRCLELPAIGMDTSFMTPLTLCDPRLQYCSTGRAQDRSVSSSNYALSQAVRRPCPHRPLAYPHSPSRMHRIPPPLFRDKSAKPSPHFSTLDLRSTFKPQ